MKMVNSKLLATLFGAAMFWAGCSGSQTSNLASENLKDSTTKTETTAETKPATAESLWTSYLKSDYCDVASVDVDAALKVLEKKGATISTLVVNPSDAKPVDMKNATASESNDNALGYYYETLSYYTLDAGGNLVLVYSERGDGGRATLQVFEYKNGKFTRLKNSFPPFLDMMLMENDEVPQNDKFAKLNGSEVWFFDYSHRITDFTDCGFLLERDHEPLTSFDWDGVKFDNHGPM